MKAQTGRGFGQILRLLTLPIICAIFAAGAWGQRGSCLVSQVDLSMGTGGVEEVMAGNLDIEVYLARGFEKLHTGGNWRDNTTNTVIVPLNRPIEVSEIRRIKMTYTSAPGFEQWLMSSFNAIASGKGVSANIATSGPYQFNWTTTVFEINTVAAPCRPGITRIEGPVRVVPGTPAESRQLLTSSQLPRTGMLQRAASGEPGAVASSSSHGPLLSSGSQTTMLSGGQTNANPSLQPLVPRNNPSGASNPGSGNGTTTLRPLSPRPVSEVTTTHAQSGNSGGGGPSTCDVTQIRMRVGTGGDDLRGGQNNLNVVVYLTGASPRVALNVNGGANWPNNSTHMVAILLKPPVAPTEIRAMRLFHVADGSFNLQSLESALTPAAPIEISKAFQSPDNWDMSNLIASALGNGVGLRIATHGFHRFTGSNPDLTIYIPPEVMASACGTGRPEGNSGDGTGSMLNPALDPGGSGLRPLTDHSAGSRYGTLTNNDVVKMVKAGVPESAIVASIRSNPTKLDTSERGLTGLRQTGVSENILQAMRQAGANPNNNPKADGTGVTNGGKNADDLNPQPYPPKSKANNQGLLPSGTQQTLLGTQANSHSGDANRSALIPVVQRPVITDGTVAGGVRPAGTPIVGASQTMSAQGNATGSGSVAAKVKQRNQYEAVTVQRGVTPDKNLANWANSGRAPENASAAHVTRTPIAIQGNPSVYVAKECAKDSSFRILLVTGASDGKTLTVGPQYTVWGCSFGNMPAVKQPRPPATSSQNQTALASQPSSYNVAVWTSNPFLIVDANIVSWNDNAIVVTFPPRPANHPGPSTAGLVLPAQVLVASGNRPTEIYGQENQVYFRPVN